jgi:hypothetical protein
MYNYINQFRVVKIKKGGFRKEPKWCIFRFLHPCSENLSLTGGCKNLNKKSYLCSESRGGARLRAPVGKALAVLDQVEAEGPLAVQILVVLFS